MCELWNSRWCYPGLVRPELTLKPKPNSQGFDRASRLRAVQQQTLHPMPRALKLYRATSATPKPQLALKKYVFVPARRLGASAVVATLATFAAGGCAHAAAVALAWPAAPRLGLAWVVGYFGVQGVVVVAERSVLDRLSSTCPPGFFREWRTASNMVRPLCCGKSFVARLGNL